MAGSMIVAAALGVLEGLTEYIPVSSTGHLLLAEHFLGLKSPGSTFAVVIQLGAILAILSIYAARLAVIFGSAGRDPRARRFIIAVALAFVPAVLVGLVAHDFIKTVLFASPRLIAISLIVGGVVLLVVDRLPLKPRYADVMDVPLGMAFKIGLAQCLALIPGVSRSGSTIVAALLLGAERRAAAEFSFFLSMPTMAAAVGFDLLKGGSALNGTLWAEIAVGFVAAFVVGVIVVKWMLAYVTQHGFALFGWWRIAVGLAALVGIWLLG